MGLTPGIGSSAANSSTKDAGMPFASSDPMRWVALSTLSLCFLCATLPARAQSADELMRARVVFADGLRDEQAHAYGPALEKFLRVKAVRDTAAVRYRIATCFENLGRLVEARALFSKVTDGARPSSDDASIDAAAKDHVTALDARIPTVEVRVADGKGALLRVDGEDGAPLEPGAPPLGLDPGEHLLVLERQGQKATERRVRVAEGARTTVTMGFEAPAPQVPTPIPAPVVAPEPAHDSSRQTLGYALGAAGLAAGIASIVAVVVRETTIADMNATCPSGVCPRDHEAQLLSQRNRASFLGPFAAALGVAGLGLTGTGVFVVITAPGKRATSGAQPAAPASAMVGLEGKF
jgi:hypothetical protein